MRPTLGASISLWSGVMMILLVTGGAIAIMFTNAFDDRLYGTKRILFVIMLLAYAIYRGFRIRQLLRADKRRHAEES